MTTDSADPADSALDSFVASRSADAKGDAVWRLNCYREALYLASLGRDDALAAAATPLFRPAAEQLMRASGSIAANIAEGYGRPTAADRARFISYALGSARETEVWYECVKTAIDPTVLADRITRISRVRRMLIRLLQRLQGGTTKPALQKW
jgi:four helix bundle protein